MFRRVLLLLALGVLSVAARADVWHGYLELPGAKLLMVFRTQQGTPPAVVDVPQQNVKGLAVDRFDVAKGKLVFEVRVLGASFEGVLNNAQTKATGTFVQNGARLPLVLEKGEPVIKAPNRPQTPKPPFPYLAEEVSFANPAADGVVLAGTLTKPKGDGPFPCVVLVTGSGPQDRDETLADHKPFAVWADALARKGIASLRYDDRGVGGSKGLFGTATTDDFASDAKAAVGFLKSRDDIRKDKIGVMGHSEGGLVAPMVAADNPDVAFIVLLAGPGVPGKDIILEQGRLIGLAEGSTPDDVEKSMQQTRAMIDAALSTTDEQEARKAVMAVIRENVEKLSDEELKALGNVDQFVAAQAGRMVNPWMRRFLVLDPREALRKVRVPVLAVWGGNDLQVPPAQSLPEARAALAENPETTLHVFPLMNHLFQLTGTGRISMYGSIETTVDEIALKYVTDWIAKTTGKR